VKRCENGQQMPSEDSKISPGKGAALKMMVMFLLVVI